MSRALIATPVRLFIFDADDTLRRTTVPGQPCPHRPGEWELRPGVRERLRRYDWGPHGLRLGIASNQDRVGYGLLTHAMAARLLAEMVVAAVGPLGPWARIALCPHRPEAGCGCRKPRPGLLLDLMGHFHLGPQATLFVGNHPDDREAAARARVRFMWEEEFFA